MSDNTIINVLLTAVVLVLMLPGLVVEPGPISEIVGLGAIMSIWGIDWSGGN